MDTYVHSWSHTISDTPFRVRERHNAGCGNTRRSHQRIGKLVLIMTVCRTSRSSKGLAIGNCKRTLRGPVGTARPRVTREMLPAPA